MPVAALLLAANIIYLVSAPSRGARIVSAAGCVATLLLWIAPAAFQRFRFNLSAEVPIRVRGGALLALVCVLIIPEVAILAMRLVGQPVREARYVIILAWLASICWALVVRRDPGASEGIDPDLPTASRRLPLLTIAFICWASMFWLAVVWDVGVGRVVLEDAGPDRITTNFQIWDKQPAREHLFLAWLSEAHFERREAYTNHLHPYLFFMYGAAKGVQWATGLPLWVGVNLTPFLKLGFGIVAFAVTIARSEAIRVGRDLKFHLILFLALGFLVTEWHFWSSLYTFNADNIFPLVLFLTAIVWAWTRPRIDEKVGRPLIIWAALFGAFGWIYWPLLIVMLWCYYGRSAPGTREFRTRNRILVSASLACALAGMIAYSAPRLVVLVNGYSSSDSSFRFRSGLDGDATYFGDMVQAVFRPTCCPERGWSDLLFPAFIPLIAFAIWALRRKHDGIWPQSVFLFSPYFSSLALVPQSVSIHPYLYDQLLFLPAAFLGAQCALLTSVQRRARGPRLLFILVLSSLLIMDNLVEIAQAMRRVLSG